MFRLNAFVIAALHRCKAYLPAAEHAPIGANQRSAGAHSKAQSKNSRKYYHFIHSFSPEDNISPEKAHILTEELCEKFFPHSEIVIATHTDTNHIHSHILINSVNFDNGKMLQISPRQYTAIKDYSNEIAERENLAVVDFRKPTKEPIRTYRRGSTSRIY